MEFWSKVICWIYMNERIILGWNKKYDDKNEVGTIFTEKLANSE